MKRFGRFSIKKTAMLICSMVLIALITGGTVLLAAVIDSKRTVTVKTSSVITNDFEGTGVNSIPVTQMSNNLDKGNNEAYFELEKSRIIKLKPAITRVWTQVDWFVTEKDFVSNGGTGADYFAGIYDFNSERMQALYKYLDIYKQIESKVILVTNWKVGSEIQKWFSIDGINTPQTSAPGDIDAYARAYTALLDYLINTKGYSNITYVSVANEPELDDFESHGDEYCYYQDTSKALADEIKRANINVSLQGLDSGAAYFTSNDFLFRSFKDNPDYFTDYALHCYQILSKAKPYLNTVKNNLPGGKTIWLTEFNGGADFEKSLSGFAGIATNLGYKSTLYWMLNDVYAEDPLSLSDNELGGGTGLWCKPQQDANVKESFYEFGLWLRYVKPHSKVLTSIVSNEDDMRSTVFNSGDDYTVIVETNTKNATSLNIKFDKAINKTFYKHVYSVGDNTEANGIIPLSIANFHVEDNLKDTVVVNKKRTVIVYTTLTDINQVSMRKVINEVSSGATLKLTANSSNSAAITWSVAAGNGTVDQDGTYTASGTHSGDTVAVKAAVDSDTYAIAIIKIK